ncbi:Uncharacterised protein [Bordetella pertussis]|nr:Uncharacterised protein [Bordetella pertussis]CFW06303.1 Uncharacterised protein [Bordetella pertussis]
MTLRSGLMSASMAKPSSLISSGWSANSGMRMRAMRRGTLKTSRAILHATRLAASEAAQAMNRSVSSAPADSSTDTWMPSPCTTRRSKRSCR